MRPYKAYYREFKVLSNWEHANLPKLPKKQTYTPPINNKTKRY